MKWLFITYPLTLIVLFIYSFTQVDLNLTLSSNPLYLALQKNLTFIGYFNRPISSLIFILIILSLTIHYIFLIRAAVKNQVSKSEITKLIFITAFILLLSYPAFSHDIFNYIFDARIIAKYGQNPYQFTALDFPSDTWTRFMHWTHRTYPYGPLWVISSLPFYIIGLGKFVLTLILFKLLFLLSYIGSIVYIRKISSIIKIEPINQSLVFFAFNPLIIIETQVSPHNEILMLFLTLIGLFFFLKGKIYKSLLMMIAAGLIKFISFIYIPILLVLNHKKLSSEKFILLLISVTSLVLIPVILSRELYPWYMITIIGLGSLLKKSLLLKLIIIALSLGTLVRYIPYLYSGEYTQITANWQLILTCLPVIIAIISYFHLQRHNKSFLS